MKFDSSPIGFMLSDHEQGQKRVIKLKNALIRYTSGDKTAAATVQIVVDEYVALLTQHIEKENHVLFAMADTKLDSIKDNELLEAFEQLERERIGPGKHEEFNALLHQLSDTHLNWSL
jgi:hemerythrin-like domain-containing protein